MAFTRNCKVRHLQITNGERGASIFNHMWVELDYASAADAIKYIRTICIESTWNQSPNPHGFDSFTWHNCCGAKVKDLTRTQTLPGTRAPIKFFSSGMKSQGQHLNVFLVVHI